MPHLGVCLVIGPLQGGLFQYNLSFVKGLAPLARRGWRLTAFALDPAWREILPPEIGLIRLRRRDLGRAASMLFRMTGSSPAAARRANALHPTARAIDAARCDLVVFPGQDEEAYVCRSRSLVAIHDLMHRYERQFREYGGIIHPYRERHFRAMSLLASGVIVDSELGKRQVVESYGADPAKIHVLPYVAPPYLARAREVDVRARHALPERYVFYPAQFWEHKNHVSLVEALALLRDRGIVVPAVFCGAPRYAYRRVVRRIRELRLEAQIRLIGYVPNDEMYSLYRSAVATVYVSLIGPTNIPPLEAMAVGCPLVVSNVYAMPEQVGDAALLVNARDPHDVAEKVERIWEDAPLRAELSRRGLERSRRWTEVEFGARLREIVEQVLGGC